jgi:protein-tyrosine phosphatase
MTWPDGEGVVEFPDGRRLRGRGLGAGRSPRSGPDPEFGLYLLARHPGPFPWPSAWIRWPDFRTPPDRPAALREIAAAVERAGTMRVEFACRGGRGRTGTALALAAVLTGVSPADAVEWIRARYDPRAVETPWQRGFVRRAAFGERGRTWSPEP